MKILLVSMGESFGGIEKIELGILEDLKNDYEINFLSPNDKSFKNYEKFIKQNNGKIYNLNVSLNGFINKIKYVHRLHRFLKLNHYDIIHINSSVYLFSFAVSLVAKISKVNKVIVHSHSIPKISIFKRILMNVLNPIYKKVTDVYISCSKEAKKSLYTNGFQKKNEIIILNDGINIDEYKFDIAARNEYRKELGINENFVIGHIGRFEKVKNHKYLINLFNEILKIDHNAKLVLIGEGSLESKIKLKVKELNIEDRVLFLGFRNDTNKLLNCMDIFILPSFNEGFGMAAIEAQVNGLPTYCSNSLSEEINVSNRFRKIDLNEDICKTAKYICGESKLINREEQIEYENLKNVDIKYMCDRLKNIYGNGEK